jgi:hypothetical protein
LAIAFNECFERNVPVNLLDHHICLPEVATDLGCAKKVLASIQMHNREASLRDYELLSNASVQHRTILTAELDWRLLLRIE